MVRKYAKVSPRLWTGSLGKALRGDPLLQSLAMYLLTSPHSNLAGLYLLPIAYICADLGHTERRIRAGLSKLEALGFCRYDDATERVWVIEALRHELGPHNGQLSPKDKRVKGLKSILGDHAVSALVQEFHEHYNLPFPSPFEAPSKPLRSQEQEQEQDGEQEQEQEDRARELVEAWNEWASRNDRPAARLTQKRRLKVLTRIGEGLAWDELVKELDRLDDFSLGRTERWNGVTFQWLTDNEENWQKVVNGNYRRKAPRDRERATVAAEQEAAW